MLLSIPLFLAGAFLTLAALRSAVRSFVLPRSSRDPFVRATFGAVRAAFGVRTVFARSFTERDRIMALYAPVSLLFLSATWLALALLGYMAMFRALGIASWTRAFAISGSSLLTLGMHDVDTLAETALSFSEAAIGLILIALLISYLPVIYGAFSRREAMVTMLDMRAGSPPTGIGILLHWQRRARLDRLERTWSRWEIWFVELEESHTSLVGLALFRSPERQRSWIGAAGAVLDAIAIERSAIDHPLASQTLMTFQSGVAALRRIAAYLGLSDPDEGIRDEEAVSVARMEFEEACARLHASGVKLRGDPDSRWRDFVRLRARYDAPLLGLAQLLVAPYVPWVSDRVRWRGADR